MPYIANESKRTELDYIAYQMSKILKVDGDLNYLLYAFCKRYVKASYNNYKNYLGELAEISAEIRRRLLAPYEDKKIEENGDVD